MGMLVNPYGVAAAPATDPYFANVVFLCHFDGTNGQQTYTNVVQPLGRGNVIGDTIGGDAAITTTAPLYGSGAVSIVSPGGVISGTHADYALGTGDFTIEFAFKTSSPGQTGPALMDLRLNAGGDLAPIIGFGSGTGSGQFHFYANGAFRVEAGAVATSTWQRIRLARVSAVTRMFLDGTQIGSDYADTNNYIQGAIYIGNSFNGFAAVNPGQIDEVRITKGVGRSAGNYTVDSGPFPDA